MMSVADEATALQCFDGRGAVRLFDADLDQGALLLEWLTGPSLASANDPEFDVRTAGSIAATLAQADRPTSVSSLAEGAAGWSRQLAEQHDRALVRGDAFDDDLFSRVVQIVDELGIDPTSTLTHGDLSLENIAQRTSGEWVAIDPLLVMGTRAHEAHTVVRSLLPQMVAGPGVDGPGVDGPGVDGPRVNEPGAAERLGRWLRLFSRAAGVDPAWAARLSLARFVASYYAESQTSGDADNIARLRAGALANAECC